MNQAARISNALHADRERIVGKMLRGLWRGPISWRRRVWRRRALSTALGLVGVELLICVVWIWHAMGVH